MYRINQFLPHANKFGFFFHTTRFVNSVFNPTVSKPRPPTVLRNAVYLWGIHLSRDQQYTAREELFLRRSLSSIDTALSNVPNAPHEALHILQANILLAYYFFHNNRLREGSVRSSAAVSLAKICSLHKQGSNNPETAADPSIGLLSLPAPKDPIEEGERIHAWWTTFILDKCWVAALGSPSTISEDDNNSNTRVDAPWPLELEQYGRVGVHYCYASMFS